MKSGIQTSTFINEYSAMESYCSPSLDMNLILSTVQEIRELKQRHNAVILSHYYMSPELQILHEFGGVADFVGDSLGLSQEAKKAEADYIIFCGVKFMAETAFILNPTKKTLLPDHRAGCSLAESISGADVRDLRQKYPGIPVVAYINTYAETKAECDICCTSRNALAIANAMPGDKLIFLPDAFMGRNLQHKIKRETGKDMILWNGKCEVHEQFTKSLINSFHLTYPEAEMLVHWEVPDDAVAEALSVSKGIVGSTTDIIRYVGESSAQQFILGSECDLGAALKGMYPKKEFITPCIKCQHMQRINLFNVLESLQSIGTSEEVKFEITIPEDIRLRALKPIERMLELS